MLETIQNTTMMTEKLTMAGQEYIETKERNQCAHMDDGPEKERTRE